MVDKEESNNEGGDNRVRWLMGIIKNHFRNIKLEKVRELFDDGVTNRSIMTFFDSNVAGALYVYEQPVGQLICGEIPPSVNPGGKDNKNSTALSLVKARGVASVRPDFCAQDILVGSFQPTDPLGHLERLTRSVFFPVLSNPSNQGQWSEVVRKEVSESIHSFNANLQITCGSVKGEITLPLPPESNKPLAAKKAAEKAALEKASVVQNRHTRKAEKNNAEKLAKEKAELDLAGQANEAINAANNKDRVHIYEGCLITWTKQIKDVLKLDPESLLNQNASAGPLSQVDFWKNKARLLNSIFDQLQGPEMRSVLRYLDNCKSTYNQPFARLCKDIATARHEANNNVQYLAPLEPWFDRLENDPYFLGLSSVFRPMMHLVLLVWKNSPFYNTAARLVVLMRQIANALIDQARKYVNGEIIFSLIAADETEKAVDMLRELLKVIGSFKSTFFDYKAKANAECVSNPWRVQNVALFMRLEAFLERCHDILDLTETVLQFSKLGKIEIGGTKGKTLTTSVQQVHSDFEDTVQHIKSVPYDVLDVDVKQFDDDFYEFRVKIKELERRLASVLSQGFDDSPTFTGRFKLLDSFDLLLERPIIADELEKKQMALVLSYGEDLMTVQQVFLDNCNEPPIANNLPPIAGALTWVRGLLDRIRLPMEKLRHLKGTILEREGAKEVVKMHTFLCASLADYEKHQIEMWEATIQNSSISKLKLPLVKRNPTTKLLKVNFDPALVLLLREVKYFLLLGLEVPSEAVAIYKKAEQFRRDSGNLDLIVQTYNHNETCVLPVERPLIKAHLARIDKILQQGLNTLTWKSHGIEPFINETASAVKEADEIVNALKNQLSVAEAMINKWASTPMFARRAKPMPIPEFEDALSAVRATHLQMAAEGSKEIHKLLKETLKKLKISQGLPDWKAYLDFVNGTMVEGLARTICVSLVYVNHQIDPAIIEKEDKSPMLEIDLVHNGKLVLFSPAIGKTAKADGVRDILDGWVQSFYKIADTVRRLDGNDGNYIKEMELNPDIQLHIAEVYHNMDVTAQQAEELREQYKRYEYLWNSDLNLIFEEFLLTAFSDVLDPETEEPTGRKILCLDKFDERIKHFEHVRTEITELPQSTNIGFLRVNSQPIKQALSTAVTKWVYMFTQYLHDYIANGLSDLQSFVTDVDKGLAFQLEAGQNMPKDKLMGVMQHIRDVRRRMESTHESFAPLRATLVLLRNHDITFEGDTINGTPVVDFLESAPDLWDSTVNKAFKAKEVIQPIQNQIADVVRKDVAEFSESVSKFRANFKATAPFGSLDEVGSADEAYAILQGFQKSLSVITLEAQGIGELEDLFELQERQYEELQDTATELQLLKTCWDVISLMEYNFTTWRSLLWKDISTDTLEDEMKRIIKNGQRSLPRSVRGWGIYKDIDKRAKNMSVTLPLVNDLHSPSMRDRHWKHLMALTCKHFDMSDNFCFNDVLKLELHLFVDEVSEIVEIANKELKIDNSLTDIEETWQGLQLEYVPHKNTDTMVLFPPEEVIEFLEEHQLLLQTMTSMGKFVEFFKDRVNMWNTTLGTVEVVLHSWLSVQRTWQSLETIFLTSADIRSQLPEDTQRFETLDKEFKQLMASASQTPSVVDVCCVPGREEILKGIWKALEKCQKALNEYLDHKKNIFPRFYFVSNMALLDILSNGNNPPKIMPHLGACFDGIAKLTLEPPVAPEGATETEIAALIPDVASAMIAKDGEVVKFPTLFKIAGPVENWLNDATLVMQDTLKAEISIAYTMSAEWAVDKPRHLWLFDYAAQIVIMCSQVCWTEECESALEELEGGQPDSLKSYVLVCNERLEALIKQVQGDLEPSHRIKIITLITIDVHARDVVCKMIDKKVEAADAFMWQQQLRYYYKRKVTGSAAAGGPEESSVGATEDDCNIRICDYRTKYSYEYTGNTGRLVITPLTDRCYITLTMALRLTLGGAPAGPAGTGKTETTKDLARSLGLPCYVFNCSDQMNYQTMGDIFKGLSQTGSWGCFDEFNRIPIEVLSVVATQVKTVLNAISFLSNPENRVEPYNMLPRGTPPYKVGHFSFMGQEVALVPTVGFFITMNPGYAGRTELPENLKAQFRSCAMIRPDLVPICENMLMAEGFVKGTNLSIKFVTLYELSSELLSPQPHYDWGLRNVKSVLRVAGALKRSEPDVDEVPILMRALRDFNTPKMPSEDLPIFLRLVSDLFPGLDLPPILNPDLKVRTIEACKQLKFQPDDTFVAKAVNFDDLLAVRHSVMLLGAAGCGKTSIWRGLLAANNQGKPVRHQSVAEIMNPKAITSDELYGYMTLQKDWKDGALSIIMRNMSKLEAPYNEHQKAHWIVLDGDIDAIWIESMNTVMDDNKVLTLVSNERIPLTDSMRMVFEINSLRNATPATVSRAGILFINDEDIGWQPYVDSWIASRTSETESANLPTLFGKYLPTVLSILKVQKLVPIVPREHIASVDSLCNMLTGMLDKLTNETRTPEIIEMFFVLATIWAFGGSLSVEKNADDRKTFSELWRSEFKTVLFPAEGLVFDYFVDPVAKEMKSWSTLVATDSNYGDQSFMNIVVATTNSVRLGYMLDLLVTNRKPVCFVGAAGTGKTTLIKEYLKSIEETIGNATINMNYYTDSMALQVQMEQEIDKRSGRIYGPAGGKDLVYFIDDLNMPFVEEYGTQTPLALLRQHMDYGCWYDRSELGLRKEIHSVQYLAAMNHKGGSFTINPRLQRHFSVFACTIPDDSDLRMIYASILKGHLERFPDKIKALGDHIVDAALELQTIVSQKFLPTAIKFHYNFNMRDFAAIFQGLTQSKAEYYVQPINFIRLFLHEASRVFADRFVSVKDITSFDEILLALSKKHFDEDSEDMFAPPLLFGRVATAGLSDEGAYLPVTSMEDLVKTLHKKLDDHNSTRPMMDLVLFADAARHVCRIMRIISSPGGNALLVGVGGSGKQSLCKLACYICDYEVFQITVTTTYSVNDLKESLKDLYRKAAVRPAVPLVFMLIDSQIMDEKFLVYVNDLLSSGHIPDLFTKDEYDSMLSAIRGDAKTAGVPDTPDNMMEFFLSRVRSNLHVVLCFSPVGAMFRLRARRFPALINCTAIDWFHPWPRDALVKVAETFLREEDLGTDDVKENVIHHIAEVHLSVIEMSEKYRNLQKRHNYVTPKSFLELIAYYRALMAEKRKGLMKSIKRLATGLATLKKTASDVSILKENLTTKMVQVEERKAETEELLIQMGVQRGEAEAQKAIADKEQLRAEKFARDAKVIEEDASVELATAKPALEAAADAVNCLTKSALTELKSLSKPPAGVDQVTTVVLMMIKNEKKNFSWDQAKRMMSNIDKFLASLLAFDSENIPQDILDRVQPIITDPDFTYEKLLKKSSAAANMANWVINILQFNAIFKKVRPLMEKLEAARAEKEQALGDLERVQQQLKEVTDRLEVLSATFMKATEEKNAVEREAEACLSRLSLAERLVNGLSSENDRWELEVEKLNVQRGTLVGDTLLASAFVSYIGAFSAPLRLSLWRDTWTNDILSREIPLTPGITPLDMIANDASVAEWCMQGLPEDPMSVDNGAIISACTRWPLIIDPQLQGITWLKTRYDTSVPPSEEALAEAAKVAKANDMPIKKPQDLIVIQMSQNRWMPKLLRAIQEGNVVIIENLGESVDAVLDPLLSRTTYKKGRQLFLRMAGSEVEFDPEFRLILQTKLANPHYKPEVAAQCTLVNFSVTERGLEDQLLARVVQFEKPELEEEKQSLQRAFNEYKIQLIRLEDTLLENLANAPDDILSDVPLIEGLEATKEKSQEVNEALRLGKETEENINRSREAYRPVASEASMLYFLMIQLCQINHMYQYSLSTFVTFFNKAMGKPPPDDDEAQRIDSLRDALRLTIYTMVARGLFEEHKDVFLAQLTFLLFRKGIISSGKDGEDDFDPECFSFLLRAPRKFDDENQIDWLPDPLWQTVCALGDLDGFGKLPENMIECAGRFQEWFNLSAPETEKLPMDWRTLDKQPFRKLLVVRALRPDRMTVAVRNFINQTLKNGEQFTECDSKFNSYQVLSDSFEDATTTVPMFFILSPGADVVADVDRLAVKYGMKESVNYHNISLGQGQDIVAMEKLNMGHKEGWWVLLNNVHLMPRWLPALEKRLDEFAAQGSHEQFRVFLTSDPSNGIPIGIVDRCIKLTNEPPTGLKANLKRAFAQFSAEDIDQTETRTRGIIFGLCHFHSLMIERKRYGSIGFNMQYPFSGQDLVACNIVLRNYMESSQGGKIPWEDLRYLFGEIMYGGHIVNDFDRLLCNAYLQFFLCDELLDEMEMFPFLASATAAGGGGGGDEGGEGGGSNEPLSFKAPPTTTYDKYLEHIDNNLNKDTPLAFGLHTNAEIGFRTEKSQYLFTTVLDLQPLEESEGGEGQSVQHVAEAMLQDILDAYREVMFDVEEIKDSIEDAGPFENVLVQETGRMNVLLQEIVRSLVELAMGFVGELSMSDAMEELMQALYMDRITESWSRLAYPSLRPLGGWLSDLQKRIQQLQGWAENPTTLPVCTWISGFFNPSSFLTAIMQVTAQTNSLELDKLCINTDVLKKQVSEIEAPPREGTLIHGLFLEGAAWSGTAIVEAQPKELFVAMPVMLCKAELADKKEHQVTFSCPVYRTQQRGPTYVFSASLRTKVAPQRWVLAGAVMVMDVV